MVVTLFMKQVYRLPWNANSNCFRQRPCFHESPLVFAIQTSSGTAPHELYVPPTV
jgi:hypothetical protein